MDHGVDLAKLEKGKADEAVKLALQRQRKASEMLMNSLELEMLSTWISNEEEMKLVDPTLVPVSLVYTTYLALNWLTNRDCHGVQEASTVKVVARRE
jgi:hypothetical protein